MIYIKSADQIIQEVRIKLQAARQGEVMWRKVVHHHPLTIPQIGKLEAELQGVVGVIMAAEIIRQYDMRAAILRSVLDAIPQTICAHGAGCEDPTCPLLLVNTAISKLL